MPRIILASGSPRRAELLSQIGLPFEVSVPSVDETPLAGESPDLYVTRLARAKALAATQRGCISLGADTSVILDGRILGKPRSRDDGISMLKALGGRSHQVLTGIAVSDGQRTESLVVSSLVTFRDLDPEEAQAYWDTGEGADKAGSYGIQGIGSIFAKSIQGSFSAVVGLPLTETESLLRAFGVDTWELRKLHLGYG
jgi:septum formation protein